MKFGSVPTQQAGGATLAHSLKVGTATLRKGRKLSAGDVETLIAAGISTVVVSVLDDTDMPENAAAEMLAATLATPNITADAAFAGRANLIATEPGVLRVDRGVVDGFNGINEAITLATLPDYARVAKGQMAATVKIIPYGVERARVDEVLERVARPALTLHPFQMRSALLVLTHTPGFKMSLIAKAEAVLRARLTALGITEITVKLVKHKLEAVTECLSGAREDLVLILGASATSDRADICPAAVVDAGGQIERFGMPVDPGNLLFLGKLGGRPVVGLPGCARSPALNGADWVLERLAAGLPISSQDIARMGAGGLLKEIPTRPQPRIGKTAPKEKPVVDILLLAAGTSSRMRGSDKLMEEIDGEALLTRTARAAANSKANRAILILPPNAEARQAAIEGLGVETTLSHHASEGMAASLRAGLETVDKDVDAVIVAFADMPEIDTAAFNDVIDAFDPQAERLIARATTATGRPGHPVLFGRPFFEALSGLKGDEGARSILRAAKEFVVDVPLGGNAAITDLDTPEDWAAWRERRDAP